MNDKKFRRTPWQRLALDNGFDGVPPGGPGRKVAAASPRKPSLTQIFNGSARQSQPQRKANLPTLKQQIEALRRKQSRPQATLELEMTGSVTRARNPGRDRSLQQTIARLTRQRNANKGLKDRFGLAANRGELKRTFNRNAKGMGL